MTATRYSDEVAAGRGTQRWKIVLGVNGSPASAHATQWAADLAARVDAQVTMITAASPVSEVLNDSLKIGLYDWRHRLRRQLHNEWARPFQERNVEYRTRLVEKSVGSALLCVAEAENADLIAIGTHRHHWVPGSLSAFLSHRASCPVVAIPLPSTPGDSSGGFSDATSTWFG